MDQRPPSARPGSRHQSRPGTASARVRRPTTAGRNSDRPQSGLTTSSGPVPPPPAAQPLFTGPRPQSRIGLTNEMIAPGSTRPGSRIGTGSRMATAAGVVPGSATGSRAMSRRGLQSSLGQGSSQMRPGTMSRAGQFPPGTASRPITQQGVSGARASTGMGSRMGTAMGGGRQIADKSYYIGLLNNQLNGLEGELANLEAELQKAEKGRENLLAYEQRAEEQAQELKHLQGQLADYNLIIDRQNTNSNLRSLETKVEQAASTNQELTAEVEELFRERRVHEEQVQELEQRIERIRAQNAERMSVMERELKEEFEQVSAEAETLRAELEQKQTEFGELAKQKEEMDLALANSPLKQQAMLLEEQLQELRDKRAGIMAELHSEETPEAQREHFVQKIQRDNEEIGHMQAQLQEMNERMTQAQEELQEFQNEFELLAGDKSERYRELKTREQHMDTFLDGFDETKRLIEGRISALSDQIVRQLQLISLNCRHGELAANVTGLDESLLALGSAGVSANELQDLHVRLQEELITMDQNEALLRTELSSMHTKQAEIDAALGQMGDTENRKAELRAETRELLAKKSALEEELNRLEAENGRLRAQAQAEERRFGSNGQLMRLRELKSRVDGLEAERRNLDEKLKEQVAKYDYEPLKQRALELRTEYNELLVTTALGRQKSAH